MEALRIENLRCLTDTGRVPIRPITLLVGRNSSGKSTFLRAFPLLRQSVETARESPILWYHDRFVDFGSFEESLNERAKEPRISFEFELPVNDGGFVQLDACRVKVTLTAHEGTARVCQYELDAVGQHITVKIDDSLAITDFLLNGRAIDLHDYPIYLSRPAFLLPTFEIEPLASPTYERFVKRSRNWDEDGRVRPLFAHSSWDTAFLDELKRVVPTLTEPQYEFWQGTMPIASVQDIDANMSALLHTEWTSQRLPPSALSDLLPHLFAGRANQIIAAADTAIADFASHVAYLAPLRATAIRGYRIQDLSVSEVDPRGENLAMFLRSLSAEDIQSFADFTRRHLDFDTSLRVLGLHADILVREAVTGRAKNLVDVGSGHAQVLPLAAILWSTCVRKARKDNGRTSLLAIEQPELHLHPAHQARLTRMFAGAMLESREAGRPVKLLIETHSEALVNGFGDLVHERILSPEDVQIAVFDQDDETRQTRVRLASYDEDGALRNWPHGFFNAIDERREAAE